MAAIPIVLLSFCIVLDIVNALHWLLANGAIIPGLAKWSNLASTLLSSLALIASAVLLITRKFKPLVVGFSITLLSTLMLVNYASWAVLTFKNS